MKNICALLLLLPFFACSQHKGMKLVWSDEFDYKGLPDSSKWVYDVGGNGWWNGEKQFYTSARTENAGVADGLLTIRAIREKWPMGVDSPNNYTSARLTTKGKLDFTYGRVDVRAKLPQGRGSWPAIWMLPSKADRKWPLDGEIDIMEHVGFDPSVIHGTVHCQLYNHSIGTQKAAQVKVPDFATAFHVYSMVWTKEYISILLDDKEYFRFTKDGKGYESWPFDIEMHLLLNVAVGGFWGGQKGIDDSIFPQTMQVDYVRVYQ